MPAALSTAPTASSRPPALELIGIDKRFGGVHALRAASFEAREGEIHAICGENGAGKSTLLKILAGVHPHGSFDGEVRLGGEVRRFRTTRDAERAGVAIVHQELTLVPELSVAENLALGREPRTALGLVDDAAVEAEARSLLARFAASSPREAGGEAGESRRVAAIDPRATAGSLGIGRQQIVEIVRALSRDARVLVLDEPTAALTGEETERLFAWLRELRRGGTTCLYVSHRLNEVMALCDRVTVLRDGETVATREVADTTSAALVQLMIGRAIDVERPRRVEGERRGEARAALEVRDLRVPDVRDDATGARFAIDGVSFTIHEGEIVALAGALGSGRTALLGTLFGGAARGYRGSIAIGGEAAALVDEASAVARGVALVPEDRKGRGLVLDLPVSQNLALPDRLPRRGLLGLLDLFTDEDDLAREAWATRRARELRLRGDARAPANALSGGNQQKIVIGKWWPRDATGGGPPRPRVLLLDEPTRGVDVGAREEIYEALEAAAARGTAVLFASSDLPEIVRLARRVLVLGAGKITAELVDEDVTEARIAEEATS